MKSVGDLRAGQCTELPSGDLSNLPRDDRRSVEMRGYIVRENNQIVDIRLIDLSYEGCGIETIAKLVPGEEVKLSVLGRGAVSARVQWCRGRKAGLVFVFEEQAKVSSKKPRPDRAPVAARAFIRRTSKHGYEVEAFDLSCRGCKCEFVERPEINECVWIKFDGLEALEAKVSWVEGSAAGFQFSTPLHPAVFDMLLQRWALPNE